MPNVDLTSTEPRPAMRSGLAASSAVRAWALATGALVLVFGVPLYELALFSLEDEAYSHLLLVPLVSAYLVWLRRKTLPISARRHIHAALIPGAVAIAVLAAYIARRVLGASALAPADDLAFTTGAFVALVVAIAGWFLGREFLRAAAFPIGFLVFMIPMPVWLVTTIETGLQHGSADAAHAMFSVVGTPLLRNDLLFQLPGTTLMVAPECSGIRSTIALFITSTVAGYFFLRSPWHRVALVAAVIPIAILRNGLRVFTIGELCVEVSPDMIDSFIHHQGGPIFYALSLIPFSLLLWGLMRLERRRAAPPRSPSHA